MTARVLVVGSLHYDITVETGGWPALGETLPARGWHPKLGGKGRNQAVAARRAGAEVAMLGAVGDDDFGRQLASDLVRRGIDTTHLLVHADRGTGMSVALFEPGGDYRALIVSSANLALTEADLPSPGEWAQAGVLVLQNEIPQGVNIAAAERGRAAGLRIILNAAPYRALPDALAAHVDLLIVNGVEAAQLGTGHEPADLGEAMAAARQLAARFAAVIVTAGGAGSAYADGSGVFAVPAEPVAVVSTHGAGDEYVGALAAALAGGAAVDEAMAVATAAAARLISAAETDRT